MRSYNESNYNKLVFPQGQVLSPDLGQPPHDPEWHTYTEFRGQVECSWHIDKSQGSDWYLITEVVSTGKQLATHLQRIENGIIGMGNGIRGNVEWGMGNGMAELWES